MVGDGNAVLLVNAAFTNSVRIASALSVGWWPEFANAANWVQWDKASFTNLR